MSDQQFVKLAKILSDNTRLKIVRMLAKMDSMCACKILEELHISQGTLSHHMNILTASKLVSCRKDGRWRHYCLLPKTLCLMAFFVREICSEPNTSSPTPCSCDKDKHK